MNVSAARLAGIAVAATLATLVAGTAPPAVALVRTSPSSSARVRPTTAPAARRSVWRAPSPAKLTRAVLHARTTKARVKAIDKVLKGVGIGVYTGAGRKVVGGFERGPRDIYLYTGEVKALAAQLGRKQDGSFAQVAAQLALAKETLHGKKVTGSRLASAVAAGIKRLARKKWKHRPEGVLAAVVRKLGQARHHDPAHSAAANALVLDPLQRLLIGIDATRSATKKTRVAARTTAGGPSARRLSGSDCGSFGGGSSYGVATGVMVATKGAVKGAPNGVIAQEIFDGVDGSAIAYSVGVAPVKPDLTGAFGTDGPQSADPMKFQVRVSMRDDYGKFTCGRGVHYNFPQKGGISGVTVTWDPDAVSHLTYLGHIVGCSNSCTSVTDTNGVATMTFQPDDEYLPGVGPKIIQHGTSTGAALIQRAAHNYLGMIAEALGFTKQAEIGWEISYHHPAGYRVDLPAQTLPLQDGATQTYRTDGLEICLAPSTQDVPHPLKPGLTPRPPGIGDQSGRGPELGLQGAWSQQPVPTGQATSPYYGSLRQTFHIDGHTQVVNEPVMAVPIDFTQSARESDTGGVDSVAQWVFDQPTLHAHITLYYVTQEEAGMTPSSHAFDVPITQARYCPAPLG
ncbi:hypothetical protein [Nocardioides terrisoli]|uniref:hypothetical protein n=1 Tax=Nocardioides terrisoli TaxID=3388267 RepID=UPI00287B9373|nr:hypothetical protein [Nocardioides marmorisolisilvae]